MTSGVGSGIIVRMSTNPAIPARSPVITAILARSSPEFVAAYEESEAMFLASSARLVRVSSLCDAFPTDGGWRLRNWYAGTESVELFDTVDAVRDAYINHGATMRAEGN